MPSDADTRSDSGAREPGRSSNNPQQRDRLLDSERAANRDQPRNFKDDALTDKRVHIEPDGTGPSPTDTMDPDRDRAMARGDVATGSHRADPPEPRDEGALESLGRAVSAPVLDAEKRTEASGDDDVDRSGAAETPRTG